MIDPTGDVATFGAGNWPVSKLERVEFSASSSWRGEGATMQIEATVPPEIAGLTFTVPATITAALAAADQAIATMNAKLAGADTAITEAAAFALLRTETLSSSRIEGMAITNRRLAEAAYDPGSAKHLAREVANNLAAIQQAVALGVNADPFAVADFVALHRILMDGVPGVGAGEIRTRQNWIGPSDTPADAAFIPPPARHVGRLLDDLARFVNRTDLSAVLQAAIAHAQFEAIHPFIDGNGRVGRCLVNVVLRRQAATVAVPPVSGVLLGDTGRYFQSLHAFQQSADPWPWVRQFAEATELACTTTERLTADIAALQSVWQRRSGNPRRGSITQRLISALPILSFTDAEQVASHLGVDPNVARRGLNALATAGVLSHVAGSKRNRVWRADEIHQLLDEYGASFTRDVGVGI